jgi:hypothetical protein
MKKAAAADWEIYVRHAERLQEEDFVRERDKDRTVLLNPYHHP